MMRISTPLNKDIISGLRAGDKVLISGIIYTARDAAHMRLQELIINNKELPFNLEGEIIYYVGPTPAPPGKIIGSAGPTTSTRMDGIAPLLLEKGLLGMIGKGNRDATVVEAIKKCGGIYFAAIGGAGALISKSIIESEVIAFPELGTEAVRKLKIIDLPVIVAIDNRGVNLYETGPSSYINREKF
uniref:Fe-S-containing hydro-lyase n=1 Tax=Alkaliphilus peptidifermentans TaxID=426129 RepID=UPI002FE603F8